jgi:hypothetical protein
MVLELNLFLNFGKSGRLSFMILLHTSINFVFDFQGQKRFCLCRFNGIHVASNFFSFFFRFDILLNPILHLILKILKEAKLNQLKEISALMVVPLSIRCLHTPLVVPCTCALCAISLYHH